MTLVIPLKIIFINCLRRGIFPDICKHANVVPVHKKNEKNVKGNYRPISLLPIFGKILEKLIFDSLYSHLVSSKLLNPNQSGFFLYSIKFYNTSYLSNATYKLLYYTTRTNTTESKYLWQLRSLNIEKKIYI